MSTFTKILLLLLWHASTTSADDDGIDGDIIVIEDFAVEPNMNWYPVNDPYIGGSSSGTIVLEDGLGKLTGEVLTLDLIKGPGFIGMQAQDKFPDVSMCEGIEIYGRSTVPYEGYRVSFGTDHADSMKYGRGYKATFKFDGTTGFEKQRISFSEFSDSWNEQTGFVTIKCVDDVEYCPNLSTLQNMAIMGIWAEGKLGVVNLEVKSISAYDCVTDNNGDLFKTLVHLFGDNPKVAEDSSGDGTKTYFGYTGMAISLALSSLAVVIALFALMLICCANQRRSKMESQPVMKEPNPDDKVV